MVMCVLHGLMEVKHVQAELPLRTYEALADLAKRRGKSIKALTQEAVERLIERENDPSSDPLHEFIGSGDRSPGDWSQQKGWRFGVRKP